MEISPIKKTSFFYCPAKFSGMVSNVVYPIDIDYDGKSPIPAYTNLYGLSVQSDQSPLAAKPDYYILWISFLE